MKITTAQLDQMNHVYTLHINNNINILLKVVEFLQEQAIFNEYLTMSKNFEISIINRQHKTKAYI